MIKDGNIQVNTMLKNTNKPSIQFNAIKGQPDEVTFVIEGIDWDVIDDYFDEDKKP